MKPSGRPKTYATLEHVNITLQPDDLARLDAIPGSSRNERIVQLLSVYDAALALPAIWQSGDPERIGAAIRNLSEVLP